MRKALGLVFLGCTLIVGLACTGDSSTPTDPGLAATSNVQSVSGALQPSKDLICHYNAAEDPYGVIVEVSSKTWRRHKDHLANNLDCEFIYDSCFDPKTTCTYSMCDDPCS